MVLKGGLLELAGAFAITLLGALARINNSKNALAVGLTYFFAVSGLTCAFFDASGAQFNPFLSGALAVTRQLAPLRAAVHAGCQLLGSLLAGLLLLALQRPASAFFRPYYGEPQLHEDEKFAAAALDLLSVAALVGVYCALAGRGRASRPVLGAAVGAVYLANSLAFGHLSGGCVNIVELLGPSLVGLRFRHWGYYLLAHFLGSAAAAVGYSLLARPGAGFASPRELLRAHAAAAADKNNNKNKQKNKQKAA